MDENIHANKMNPNKNVKNSLLLTSSYIKQKLLDCFRKLENKIYIFYIKFLNFLHTYNHVKMNELDELKLVKFAHCLCFCVFCPTFVFKAI